MRTSLTFPEEFDSDDFECFGADYQQISDEREAKAHVKTGQTIEEFITSDARRAAFTAVVIGGEHITELLVTRQAKWRRFEMEWLLGCGKSETDGHELLWTSVFLQEARDLMAAAPVVAQEGGRPNR